MNTKLASSRLVQDRGMRTPRQKHYRIAGRDSVQCGSGAAGIEERNPADHSLHKRSRRLLAHGLPHFFEHLRTWRFHTAEVQHDALEIAAEVGVHVIQAGNYQVAGEINAPRARAG